MEHWMIIPTSSTLKIPTLYDAGVAKITTVEEALDISDDDEKILDLAQDTVTLINSEVDNIEEVKDKAKMKKIIKDLYMESLSI